MNMQSFTSRRWLVAAIVASMLGGCVIADPPFLTIDGPETPELRTGLVGHVATPVTRSRCGRTTGIGGGSSPACVSMAPDTGPAPPDLSKAMIAAVLPESAGSMLLLEYRRSTLTNERERGANRHPPGTIALERVRCSTDACDTARERIAAWPSASLNDVYGKTLAVSPDGRRVAVLPSSEVFQTDGYSPRLQAGLRFPTDRMVGDLHVVDLGTGVDRVVQTRVLDGEPVSWSADGRRLLFIRLETADALPSRLAAELRGNERPPGTGLPLVETVDVVSGATETIALGMNAVWSPDQGTLLFASSIDHLELRELATGVSRPLYLPGYVGRYPWVRFVGPRRVLYRAVPTTGALPGFTGHNSPLIGPKQLVTLKVADVDTLQFTTVLDDLDPRHDLSFNPRY